MNKEKRAAAEALEVAKEAAETVKMVAKEVVCPRCDGDGFWHSTATGVRAGTMSGPLVDETASCPRCEGVKTVNIMITEEQAIAEAAAIKRDKVSAIGKVTREANAAIKQIKRNAATEADKIKAKV